MQDNKICPGTFSDSNFWKLGTRNRQEFIFFLHGNGKFLQRVARTAVLREICCQFFAPQLGFSGFRIFLILVYTAQYLFLAGLDRTCVVWACNWCDKTKRIVVFWRDVKFKDRKTPQGHISLAPT